MSVTGGSQRKRTRRVRFRAAERGSGLVSLVAIALLVASVLCASLLAVGGPVGQAPAQAQTTPSTEEGLRVYSIVVDGLRPQEVNPILTPTLNELKSKGTWYEEARAVFPAETFPTTRR